MRTDANLGSNDRHGLRRLTVAVLSHAWRRVSADAWLLLQRTMAATIAWAIANHVFEHHEPFFAPIAAVVALNAALGERGSNALRLLLGVAVGIVVGELTVAVLFGGAWAMVPSIFAAMAVARALGGARVTIAQAASAAILTVTSANGQVGPERLVDALIGAGVALVFSQFLFSPEPVALLRRVESAALADMSDGLDLTARALEHDDDDLDERALNSMRDLRERLVELTRLRDASARVARHSLVWRSHVTPVVREKESADHLDLLGGSCLMLTRASIATAPTERRSLAPRVRELANVLRDLAKELGGRQTRQCAADRALDVARRSAGTVAPSELPLAAALMTMRMVAADVVEFAGVAPEQRADTMRERSGEPHVPLPPAVPRR